MQMETECLKGHFSSFSRITGLLLISKLGQFHDLGFRFPFKFSRKKKNKGVHYWTSNSWLVGTVFFWKLRRTLEGDAASHLSPLTGRFYLPWALFRFGNKYICIVIEKTIYSSGWWQQYSNSYNQTRSWAAKPVIFLKPSNRPSNIWPFKDGNCSIYWLLNFSNGCYGCLVYIVHNNLMY